MERTTRLLLTREAALRKVNSLDISRENTLRIRCLDVRFGLDHGVGHPNHSCPRGKHLTH